MRDWIKAAIAGVWALWFGGIVSLFIFAQTLFASVPRATFIETAPHLFFAFERYQLILAAIGLLLTLLWRVVGSGRATAVFAMFALATLFAVISTAIITPRIEQLRIAGQTQTEQFKKTHGLSMVVYLADAFAVLGAGVILLWPREREIIRATAPASPSPASAGHPASPLPA